MGDLDTGQEMMNQPGADERADDIKIDSQF